MSLVACERDKKTAEAPVDKAAAPHTFNEEEKVRNTVILYTSFLAEGYRQQNMNQLMQVATEQRATKAYYHMAALGEGNVKMDSKLNEITFTNVKVIPPDKADAETVEKWDYKYIDFKTGKEVHENSVTYVLGYHLVKISEKWYVDDITVVSAKEKKSEQYLPFTDRPGSEEKKHE